MTAYITRRLVTSIPTLVLISMVVFGILALAPGDPLGQFAANPDIPPEVTTPRPRAYVVSESLLASRRIPALTGANGNGNGHSNGHSNGNGNGNGSRKGNGHGPVKGSDLTPWGRAGDAPEGWS